ncbi:MAG: hypothetical protein PVG75_01955 [Thioalkalispiraceae bacterium]|jgi:hypothetical protein
MKISSILQTGFLAFCFMLAVPVKAVDAMQEDNTHVETWNQFAEDILSLHEQVIKQNNLTKTVDVGGYFGNPDFYIEEIYRDKETDKLVSRVLWERENPENLHTIELFIRDEDGRVLRDYVAAYLPTYRNAPTQTLVTLYQYNGDLEAYRTFDASGDRLGERCVGELKGEEVNFMLGEEEILDAIHGDSERMQQPDYKACFKGLQKKPGKYLTPQ